jgi:hypothetical protein
MSGEALGARHAKMIADCVASTRTTTPAAYPQRGIVCHRCRKVVAATVSSHEIAWASWCMDCWAGANARLDRPEGAKETP